MVRVRFFQAIMSREFLNGDWNAPRASLVRDCTMPAPPVEGLVIASDTEILRSDPCNPGMAVRGVEIRKVFYDLQMMRYEAVMVARVLAIADVVDEACDMIKRGWSVAELPLDPPSPTQKRSAYETIRVQFTGENFDRLATKYDIRLLVHEGVQFLRKD